MMKIVLKNKTVLVKRILFLVAFAAIIFTGCGKDNSKESNNHNNHPKTDENQVRIYDIEMTIASKNDSHIYSAKYPYHFYYIDRQTHSGRLTDMKDDLAKVISREDFELFADFINSSGQEMKFNTGDVFTYSVSVSYYDEEDESQRLYCYGYNDFPTELNGLIDRFNQLSGAVIFNYPDQLITDVPAFAYNEFGMETTEYSEEEVRLALEYYDYFFPSLVGNLNSMNSIVEGYYKELDAQKIEYMMPTEEMKDQKHPKVSDDEFMEFLQTFLHELGGTWKIRGDGTVYALMELCDENENIIIVGRTQDIDDFGPVYDNGVIYLDAGMEGMTYTSDFMINKSGKYFLCEFWDEADFAAIAETFYTTE